MGSKFSIDCSILFEIGFFLIWSSGGQFILINQEGKVIKGGNSRNNINPEERYLVLQVE